MSVQFGLEGWGVVVFRFRPPQCPTVAVDEQKIDAIIANKNVESNQTRSPRTPPVIVRAKTEHA